MDKIFITGGNGFLGSRIIKTYSDRYEFISQTSDKLDITDENKVFSIIKETRPDYIIHAAAIAETKFCDENPETAYNINVKGAVNIAKAASAAGSKMIFLSTEQIFNGNSAPGPFSEDAIPSPNTEYGKTKLKAEEELRMVSDEIWILRLTWLFGLPERKLKINPNILWDTIKAAYSGEQIPVPSNEFRGLTYVYDLVDQLEKVFHMEFGTYHTGSHNDMNRYEVSRYILQLIGVSQANIEKLIVEDSDKYKDKIRDVRLNTAKIKNHGFIFEDAQETLEKCLKEFNVTR
ncbi:MAG: NAD(P)-dependent oxidoreductase [Eubacteriaceae bacterium]|nr:NAD(P)-dependent oxidoreductase [Eubacteriaceae bacterium]